MLPFSGLRGFTRIYKMIEKSFMILEYWMSQLHNNVLRSIILKTFLEVAAGEAGIFVSLIPGNTQGKLLTFCLFTI
jgi:hypothetical protein